MQGAKVARIIAPKEEKRSGQTTIDKFVGYNYQANKEACNNQKVIAKIHNKIIKDYYTINMEQSMISICFMRECHPETRVGNK
jgi:hypothetical protein